jgi:hypothetical protein
MIELMIRLGQLGLGFAAILGPVLMLLLLLRRRDQRRAILSRVVSRQLNVPNLRGLYTVTIQIHLLRRRDTVTVEIRSYPGLQLWDVIMGLSAKLPAQVWLAVDGVPHATSNSTFTLRVKRDMPFTFPPLATAC